MYVYMYVKQKFKYFHFVLIKIFLPFKISQVAQTLITDSRNLKKILFRCMFLQKKKSTPFCKRVLCALLHQWWNENLCVKE